MSGYRKKHTQCTLPTPYLCIAYDRCWLFLLLLFLMRYVPEVIKMDFPCGSGHRQQNEFCHSNKQFYLRRRVCSKQCSTVLKVLENQFTNPMKGLLSLYSTAPNFLSKLWTNAPVHRVLGHPLKQSVLDLRNKEPFASFHHRQETKILVKETSQSIRSAPVASSAITVASPVSLQP